MDCSKASHKFRAPRAHGETLVEPSPRDIRSLLQSNRDTLGAISYSLQGRDIVSLASAARSQLLSAARCYTSDYRDVTFAETQTENSPVILAGHQPELFHMGVWFKNLILGSLASEHSAVALNLLIDNDACRAAVVRVPGGSPAAPTIRSVDLDRTSSSQIKAIQPYEERAIQDFEQFASFGQRASEILRPFVSEPLLQDYWPIAVERAKATGNLGLALAQSRHQFEGAQSVQTLELPLSEVCQLEAFHWFLAHLLAQLPRFWDIYNASLADYRKANHLRSHTHPAPDLADVDDWLEAPFWIWSVDNPVRKPLFVRSAGEQLILSDRDSIHVKLDLCPDRDADTAVAQLADLQSQGIKIRPRALVTTMFARLLLGDLFLHGIGGAKYDELTDQIIRRFFQIDPPSYVVLSATMLLPIARVRPDAQQEQQIKRDLRRLTFHPEHFLQQTNPPETQDLIAKKTGWINTEKTPTNARERHQAIEHVNAALQPQVADQRSRLLAQQTHIQNALRNEAILASREYAFCLHPGENLDYLLEKATQV